ncbi:hypothetical protein AFK68_13735 [Hydrocoleum sp. CS-953]|nr:hypothetical protein AFK68_13735 [Hydrocoleum sp. CS-953]
MPVEVVLPTVPLEGGHTPRRRKTQAVRPRAAVSRSDMFAEHSLYEKALAQLLWKRQLLCKRQVASGQTPRRRKAQGNADQERER